MTIQIKDEILKLVKKYHKANKQSSFVCGRDYIPAAQAVYDDKEIASLVSASLDMRWVDGQIVQQFERDMAKFIGVRYATMVNSGSSANLIALTALTSSLLKSKTLKPGDEVITVAAGFPTTVNPIIQNGLIPVFVDVNIGTYNTTPFLVESAITEKTKAIFIAHTLGNPYDVEEIKEIAKYHSLWLIEDIADALGAELGGKKLGTFGNLATTSLYPAHIISVGEGGMIFTDSPMLDKIVRSFRDWGRSCWCLPGKDNTCGKRFSQKDCGALPDGFDHKYIFSHIGYNLKSTDLQASIGIEQLRKLPDFLEHRRENWVYLSSQFLENGLDRFFVLPKQTKKSSPAWFGFLLTIKDNAKFSRNEIVQFLEKNMIGTRNLFAGNLTKQPAYLDKEWRIHGGLPHTDTIMEKTFWIGCHPGMTKKKLDYIVSKFVEFTSHYENNSNC